MSTTVAEATQASADAATVAVSNGPSDVALSTIDDLIPFSNHVGGENYLDWFGRGRPTSWFPARFEEVLNAAEHIHFNLSVRGSMLFADAVALRGTGIDPFGQVHITTWELLQVSKNDAWLGKITFYQRTGFNQWDVIPSPFASAP